MKMKIFIASDHAGFALKEYLVGALAKKYEVVDVGPYSFDKKDDYPDFVIPCCEKVVEAGGFGIVVGKSGVGEAIAANKVRGVRCVLYYGGSKKILKLSREHNDSNVLSLGADFLSKVEALKSIEFWLKQKFGKDKRHVRRIEKIKKFEGNRE